MAKNMMEYTVVKDRVLHVDGDIIPYLVCSKDVTTEAEVVVRVHDFITGCVRNSQADTFLLHWSHPNKGGRNDAATVKPYKGNREGASLHPLYQFAKQYTESTFPKVDNAGYEADDTLAQAQWTAYKEGNKDLSVIVSTDKDLNIVPGLHYCVRTGEVYEVDTFGDIVYEKGQIRGTGSKLFWAQMLTGDSADNIPGVMKITGVTMAEYCPTKKVTQWKDDIYGESDEKADKAIDNLNSYARKLFNCGAARAYKILKDARNDKECLERVLKVYGLSWHQDTKLQKEYNINYLSMFYEQGYLLWLQSYGHFRDVLLNVLNSGAVYEKPKQYGKSNAKIRKDDTDKSPKGKNVAFTKQDLSSMRTLH